MLDMQPTQISLLRRSSMWDTTKWDTTNARFAANGFKPIASSLVSSLLVAEFDGSHHRWQLCGCRQWFPHPSTLWVTWLHHGLIALGSGVLASLGTVPSSCAAPLEVSPNCRHAVTTDCMPDMAFQDAIATPEVITSSESISQAPLLAEKLPLQAQAIAMPTIDATTVQFAPSPSDVLRSPYILSETHELTDDGGAPPRSHSPAQSLTASALDTHSSTVALTPSSGRAIDLRPEVIEQSPLLQRWLQQVPDVTSEITYSPSFRTRLRLGYSQFPSTNQALGINLGIEDVFLGRSGFTISGDYYTTFDGQRQGWGADLHYYLRPLGSYVNISPVVGYRHVDTPLYSTDGLNVGLRLMVVLSRGGGADFSLTQSWLAPGSDREIGIFNFSAGYALTSTLRLSADLQQQNARQRQDSRAAIVLEWML